MALILTFLGKGGVGRSVSAIATAKKLAAQGQRTLLVTQDAGPGFGLLLGKPFGTGTQASQPENIEPSLWAVQLGTASLLEKNWELLKQLEAKYLRDPFFKAVFGQELSVLPGMDDALALNALREYDGCGLYDAIVYDGSGDQASLRMWGMPEGIDWYFRRFKQVFQASQFSKTVAPFIQPIAGAILSINLSGDMFDHPQMQEANGFLTEGKAAVNNPQRVRAYLVSTADPVAIATARYLWGAAQQVGLTVGGAWVNRTTRDHTSDFSDIPISQLPPWSPDHWQPLVEAIPDILNPPAVPAPMSVNLAERTVKLFLPSFDKKQIQLTQYGPEVTVEAGDQRRNLNLPSKLRGLSVSGAKFQDNYLILSFS